MLVKGLLCRLASLEWPQLLSVLFLKVEEKGNWFHGPSETEKGALAGITL